MTTLSLYTAVFFMLVPCDPTQSCCHILSRASVAAPQGRALDLAVHTGQRVLLGSQPRDPLPRDRTLRGPEGVNLPSRFCRLQQRFLGSCCPLVPAKGSASGEATSRQGDTEDWWASCPSLSPPPLPWGFGGGWVWLLVFQVLRSICTWVLTFFKAWREAGLSPSTLENFI